jgi:hypothetical protein
MLNIGMDMSEVLLPQLEMEAFYDGSENDNSQINSSSIYSYLNIRGLGRTTSGTGNVKRYFNAIPYLGYWDVYKNYYANKQEERGFVIHQANPNDDFRVMSCNVKVVSSAGVVTKDIHASDESIDTDPQGATGTVEVTCDVVLSWNSGTTTAYGAPDMNDFVIDIAGTNFTIPQLFTNVNLPSFFVDGELPNGGIPAPGNFTVECSGYVGALGVADWDATGQTDVNNTSEVSGPPQLTEFPLDNIDDMRMDILEAVRDTTAFIIDKTTEAPSSWCI